MDFRAPLHTGDTILNYRNRPSVSGDLVSLTGNEAQGDSLYAIVKVKPPQDYVTFLDGRMSNSNDMELEVGYWYRVGRVTRVWIGDNPDTGWRVELTKDKVETFLNYANATWALRQPGDLTPSDLGLPPLGEAEDQPFYELSDEALGSTMGAIGLKLNYTPCNFSTSVRLWYPGVNGDIGSNGNGQIDLKNTGADISEAFIAQVKRLNRKLTDGNIEMGFDNLDLPEPGRSYNYGQDFFSRYGIRSVALARTGKWNITLGGQTVSIDGPGNLTGITPLEGLQDGRVFKYYKNNMGHIEGVRYLGNYYSIPTIDLSVPVSEYVNHMLDLNAETSIDTDTLMIAGVNGVMALANVLSTAAAIKNDAGSEAESELSTAKYKLGAVSNVLNGGLGPLIPPEYQSTLGYALAGALGLTSLQSAYQKKLQLNGTNGAFIKSTVADVYYAYKSATGFTSIPDLSAFTIGSSTLFGSSSINNGEVGRKRSATPIDLPYLGPRDCLSEGLAYVSNGFYVRAQI